jgi:long-chain fatty acid transport protein
LDARFSVLIDATKFSSLSLPRFNIAGLAQYDPAQLTLEGAWIRQERVLGLSLTYKRWSRYPGQLEPTILCPPDEPDCGALTPPKAETSDTVVVRVGAEQRVLRSRVLALRVRAGAFLEPTPLSADLPSSAAYDRPTKSVIQVPTRYFDASRLGLTWGLGLTFAKFPMDFDVYGQYQALLPREHRFAAGSGGAAATTATSTASGHVLAFGFSTGVKF